MSIKDKIASVKDTVAFLTEDIDSEDAGKTRDEWNESKGKGSK